MNEGYAEKKKCFTLIRPNFDAAKDVATFCDRFGNQTAIRSFFSKPNSRRDAAKLSTSSLNDLNVYRFCSPKIFHEYQIE
jgi:hypothetical protein